MTEPDWLLAPKWAEWFAIDDDGEAWWYETKPHAKTNDGMWRQEFHGNIYRGSEHAGVYPELAADWKNSLRQRP
jgi:hypothetical protein